MYNRHKFVSVETLEGDKEMDGNYLVHDSKRSLRFRSGIAEVGLMIRWKGHISASRRSSNEHRSNTFYSAHRSMHCEQDNLPSKEEKFGNFQQLDQLIGIGMRK